MVLWADHFDPFKGSLLVSRWASFRLLFPANEQYPKHIKLAHFETQDEADKLAFDLTIKDTRLLGTLTVEECWIKRCKRCHDCLCGEGNRRRE